MAGGLLVAVIGVVVLLGWAWHVAVFKSVLPNTVTMKANTALCFVLLGLAVAILAKSTRPAWRRLARVLAGVVVAVAALSLIEYVFNVNLHIDQLLFAEDSSPIGTSNPGRMAVNTAVVFVALGLVLISAAGQAADRYRRRLVAILVAGFFFTYLPFVGYILGVREVTGISTFTKMAPHTSAALLLAIVAILFLPVGRDLTGRIFSVAIDGRLLRRSLPFALIAPVVLNWLLNRLVVMGYLDLNYALGISVIFTAVIFVMLFWEYALYVERNDEEEKSLAALKDQFLFIAAHELRAPVTAIKWGTELVGQQLAESHLAEEVTEVLKDVRENAERLTALVNDLLDTSRLDYGTFRLQLAETDLKQCVAASARNLQAIADKAGVSLRLEVPAGPVTTMTDCERIGEVVANLVSNAIKYNRRGGWVEVALASNGERTTIRVSDNGLGLSTEDIGRLFQRFSRIETEETRKIPGTGLGLFIVARLTQLLGGTVEVMSPGRGLGSTFTVNLTPRPSAKKA